MFYLNNFTSIILLIILVCCCSFEFSSCQQTTDSRLPYYQLPNPFEAQNDWYSIKSYQTFVSPQRKKTQIEVEEYFSLSEGLTYSLLKNRDNLDQVYAIIGDSIRAKSYIVRNPEAQSDEQIQCELDHIHSHKHVFPWQYSYTTSDSSHTKDGEATKTKSIYGVGAIWLNAIKKKIVSDAVGVDSPYPATNLWLMREGDLEVKLLFDKPTETRSGGDMAKLIANSPISSIQMRRENVLSLEPTSSETNLINFETENILISEFRTNLNADDKENSILQRFRQQLKHCREFNSQHRIFPSLIRALSLSKKRLYGLQYIARKFPATDVDDANEGQYNEKLLRHSWQNEIIIEVFSFREEAQITWYSSLPKREEDFLNEESDYGDIFIKKLTEDEKTRSSRHATVSYHIFQRKGKEESCKVREDEPLPTDRLMIRPIHFVRPLGKRITGRLTGIGALIMNAADVNYKQFNLFKRKISASLDATNPYYTEDLTVDEWQFYDKKTDRTYHFYFHDLGFQVRGHHDIKDLVRIDVRDSKATDTTGEGLIDIERDEDGLIMRYDILSFFTELRDSRIKILFTPPKMCFNIGPPEDNSDNDEDSEAESDEEDDDIEFDVSDDEELDEEEELLDQVEGEDMEFQPGKMLESSQFPDFFEYLDGQTSYAIESQIELLDQDQSPNQHRFITLKEVVDIEKGWTQLSIYFQQKSGVNSPKPLIYYINYNSELILRLDGEQGACSQVNNVEGWLQLLSASSNYYLTPDENADGDSTGDLMIESSTLRHYGVGALWQNAAESVYTDFVGMKKNNIAINTGSKQRNYRELIWSLADDGDHDMIMHFKFLWDLTQWESDKEKHRRRRTIEMIHLDSIYIADMNGDQGESGGTNFKKFNIQVKSFEKLTNSKELELPTNCQYILDTINANAAKERQRFTEVKIPSLSDYLVNSKSQSYSLDYTIKHALHNRNNEEEPVENLLPVKEYFNMNDNLFKLTVGQGQDTREIFVDGKKRSILAYLPASDTCKSIGTLKPLVDLGGSFTEVNENFDVQKMYGLGSLWKQLSNLTKVQLHVTQRHDNSANRYEVRTYEVYQLLSGGTVSSLIRLTFVSKPGIKPTKTFEDIAKTSSGFQLESISFWSDMFRPRDGANLHKTVISINSIKSSSPRVWDLPTVCEKLLPNDEAVNEQQNVNGLKFPKVMELIKVTQQFHIRSEVALLEGAARQKAQRNGDQNLFLVDEWLYRRDVRLRTYGLKKNIDLMIYGITKESFDLSVPYTCPTEVPILDIYTPNYINSSNLIQFWNDNSTLVDSLSQLYYSPIALWWLTEKASSTGDVKLLNSIEIAPKVMSNSYADYLAKDTRSEVWRYVHEKWTLDFFFEKFSRNRADGSLQEWHVLERVIVNEPDVVGKLQIEVVNYEWNQKVDQYRDLFLLPEGYGCRRSSEITDEMRKINDEINLNVDLDLWLSYEASFELYDSAGNKTVLPTVSGTYAKSNSLSPLTWDDVSAHYSRARNYNGTVVSTKTVYDTDHSMFYRINRLNGECIRSFTPNLQGRDWIIDFPLATGEVKSVEMRMGLFRDLFQRTAPMQFRPLNRYVDNGELVTVYENSFENFRLIGNTAPPVTIVRKFSSPENRIKLRKDGAIVTRLHRSTSVKVLLFDKNRTKPQAELNISLLRFSNTLITDIIRLTNIAQCFYDGSTVSDKAVGTFTIEYKLNNEKLIYHPSFNRNSIGHLFIRDLIKYFKVLPTQVNGAPRVDIRDDGVFKIHFSILEAPTAIEYFRKKLDSTMTDEMSIFAEVKLVSPLIECSHWCDSVGCIAMSYCNDRTCRVLTPNMIQGEARRTIGLDSTIGSEQCSFFYRSASTSTSLQLFTQKLDAHINRISIPEDEKMILALTIENETMYPRRFYDSSSSFQDMDDHSTFMTNDAVSPTNKAEEVYKIFKKDHRLSIGALEELENTYPLVVHTDTYSSCLDRCNLMSCSIMSYCKLDTSCVIVSDVKDFKKVQTAIEPSEGSCTVTVNDFTAKYNRFADTSAPRIFLREYTNYSTLECAALCDNFGDQTQEDSIGCLSFDSCSTELKEPRNLDESNGTICYVQKSHLMMDDFDRNILEPRHLNDSPSTRNNQKLVCDHYSKHILADYRRLINRQFNETSKLPVLRGHSADRCALDCSQDDECTAFQYCFDDRSSPAQLCYLMRMSEPSTIDEESNKTMATLLVESKSCSVFVLRHKTEKLNFDKDERSFTTEDLKQIFVQHRGFLVFTLIALSYIVTALILGSAIQLLYIQIVGQPVIFD